MKTVPISETSIMAREAFMDFMLSVQSEEWCWEDFEMFMEGAGDSIPPGQLILMASVFKSMSAIMEAEGKECALQQIPEKGGQMSDWGVLFQRREPHKQVRLETAEVYRDFGKPTVEQFEANPEKYPYYKVIPVKGTVAVTPPK